MARGKTRPLEPTKVGWPRPSTQAIRSSGPKSAIQALAVSAAGPYRPRKRSIGSEWVRFRPPRPAISSFRAGDGVCSCTTTFNPAWARRSAAVRPAGPAPTTWIAGSA